MKTLFPVPPYPHLAGPVALLVAGKVVGSVIPSSPPLIATPVQLAEIQLAYTSEPRP